MTEAKARLPVKERILGWIIASFAWLMWLLNTLWRGSLYAYRWVTALDRDALEPSDKEGYGVFSALAGFALAEAAALTVVARDEAYKRLVLGVYVASVVLTHCCLVAMLRAKRNVDAPGGVSVDRRAFDRPSIRYARWVLVWNITSAIFLIILGWNDLLPNQTPRVVFTKSQIECDTLYLSSYKERSTPSQQEMDDWIARLASTARQAATATSADEKETFFILQQKTPFERSFKEFTVQLRNENERYWLGLRVAFLVKPASVGLGRTYRQVAFHDPQADQVFVDSLSIEDANKGEYLVVLLFARDSKKQENPTTENVNVTLKKL